MTGAEITTRIYPSYCEATTLGVEVVLFEASRGNRVPQTAEAKVSSSVVCMAPVAIIWKMG
jgi:hypothetical protein